MLHEGFSYRFTDAVVRRPGLSVVNGLLKSDCSLLDSETILATSRLSGAECFAPFRVLTVPPGEEAAANSVRVNDSVLVPAGFPATAELIARADYAVEVVAAGQAALLDGGLSCMSLRFDQKLLSTCC